MILTEQRLSAATPALWYVTNGDTVVGPVGTDLLLRGITSARIPDDCRVIQESWGEWRSLLEIRELSAIGPIPSWSEGGGGLLAASSRGARGESRERRRSAAVCHARRGHRGPCHRWARAPHQGALRGSRDFVRARRRWGARSDPPPHDPALAVAEERKILMGRPTDGPAERAIARRFMACGELSGVAMIPVFDGETLLAMLELARTDHPFRAADTETLLRIAQMVSRK